MPTERAESDVLPELLRPFLLGRSRRPGQTGLGDQPFFAGFGAGGGGDGDFAGATTAGGV